MWLQSNAELVADFGLWMTAVHNGKNTWLDVVDFESLIKGADSETPVFVDVGGGVGSQCAILKAKYPNLTGRVILQDLMAVIEHHALPTEGVENTVFDFWGEQPIKGKTDASYQPPSTYLTNQKVPRHTTYETSSMITQTRRL